MVQPAYRVDKTRMIPDNIAETGVFENGRGAVCYWIFEEHSPLSLTEQSRRSTVESQFGNSVKKPVNVRSD